jgi:soluble lytic murein transglycosylase-like protein
VTEPAVPELSEMVRIYADRIQTLNRRVDAAEAQRIAHYIIAKSEKYGVDPRLTFALVKQESNFSRTAVSHAGARGLGQLMPGTAVGLKVYDSFDIEQNLDGTVHYLKGQLDRFGRVSLALAAYNAGPGRVQRAGNAVPNIAETQHYVQVIWRDYCTFAGLDPASGEPAQG